MLRLELIREWLGASGVEWVCPFSYHARGTNTRRPDLDVGICQAAPLSVGRLSVLRERLEESKFVFLDAGGSAGCAACAAAVRRKGRGGVHGFAQRLSMAQKALAVCPSHYLALVQCRIEILWGDL